MCARLAPAHSVCPSVFVHNSEVQACVLGAHCSRGKHFHVGQFGAGCFEGTLMLPPALGRWGMHTGRAPGWAGQSQRNEAWPF